MTVCLSIRALRCQTFIARRSLSLSLCMSWCFSVYAKVCRRKDAPYLSSRLRLLDHLVLCVLFGVKHVVFLSSIYRVYKIPHRLLCGASWPEPSDQSRWTVSTLNGIHLCFSHHVIKKLMSEWPKRNSLPVEQVRVEYLSYHWMKLMFGRKPQRSLDELQTTFRHVVLVLVLCGVSTVNFRLLMHNIGRSILDSVGTWSRHDDKWAFSTFNHKCLGCDKSRCRTIMLSASTFSRGFCLIVFRQILMKILEATIDCFAHSHCLTCAAKRIERWRRSFDIQTNWKYKVTRETLDLVSYYFLYFFFDRKEEKIPNSVHRVIFSRLTETRVRITGSSLSLAHEGP